MKAEAAQLLLGLWSSCLLHMKKLKGNQSIYLHRSGPLLEDGLDRPKNRHFHIYRSGGWSQSLPLKIFFSCSLGGGLVAFHPRPQIASDLGRNVTRSFNPHRNRNQFPSGNETLAYGRRFKSQPASTRCDLRIASPTRPLLQVI